MKIINAMDFSQKLHFLWILQSLIFRKVRVEWDTLQKAFVRIVPTRVMKKDGWYIPLPNQLIKYKIKAL